MKNFPSIVLPLVFVPLLGVGIALAAAAGLDRTAIADCNTWAAQASTTPNFYITQSQKDQCDFYKIPVNASVID